MQIRSDLRVHKIKKMREKEMFVFKKKTQTKIK